MSLSSCCTPGEWKAVVGNPDDETRWGIVVADREKQWFVATIENGSPGDTLFTEGHNARMMAASKVMFEALEDIVHQLAAVQSHVPADLADSIRVFGVRAIEKALKG